MMSESPRDALHWIAGLGTSDELWAMAKQTPPPDWRMGVNAHIHLPPNFSAFTDVAQAVTLAAEQGVAVLGTSNYYDFRVYGEFAALARRHKIFPLFGLEVIAMIDHLAAAGVKINDPGNPGKIYVCGKGITRFEAPGDVARNLLGLIRRNDGERMARMGEKLAAILAQHGVRADLSAAAIIEAVVRRHGCPRESVCLQERHVAQACQEAIFAAVPPEERTVALSAIFAAPSKANPDDKAAVQNEIRGHLMKAGKPAFVAETFIPFEQARGLILELGGMPCYPILADGASPVCGFEEPVETLVDHVKSLGLCCVELIPIRNKPDVLTRYATAMRRAGLVVMGGTEHNTPDLLPIEPICLGGQPVPEDVKAMFREGARVGAAHQVLSAQGQCGFVNETGEKNPAYATDEDRIKAFASLGAAVMAKSTS